MKCLNNYQVPLLAQSFIVFQYGAFYIRRIKWSCLIKKKGGGKGRRRRSGMKAWTDVLFQLHM